MYFFYDGLVGKGVWGLGVCVWVIGWAMGIRGEATSQVQKGSKMPVVARVNHTPTPQLDIKIRQKRPVVAC